MYNIEYFKRSRWMIPRHARPFNAVFIHLCANHDLYKKMLIVERISKQLKENSEEKILQSWFLGRFSMLDVICRRCWTVECSGTYTVSIACRIEHVISCHAQCIFTIVGDDHYRSPFLKNLLFISKFMLPWFGIEVLQRTSAVDRQKSYVFMQKKIVFKSCFNTYFMDFCTPKRIIVIHGRFSKFVKQLT